MHPAELDLLKTFSPRLRAEIIKATDRLRLKAGETLFEAGDDGDALYVVITGSLGVYYTGPSGYPQLAAVVKPGETVGELAVISGEPRSATVTAIRDSDLISLTKQQFDRLVASKPAIMNELNRLLVRRLQQVATQSGAELEPKTIAILPATVNCNSVLVQHQLCSALDTMKVSYKTITLAQSGELREDLYEYESKNDLVLLAGDAHDQTWNARCARQADRIIIVANAATRVSCELPVEILTRRARHQLVDLVLLQASGIELPKKTAEWLKVIPVNRHFHITGEKQSWARLARILTGRSIGLVLSGGGARAYAHIGVLKAIEEAGIEIDFIGGTSMGAIIAACHAYGWDCNKLQDRIYRTFVKSNPLSDYTLPILSLVRGLKVERLLRENFGSANIADLWKPFFCASSNLTNGLVHIHHSGLVWKALRASISLPGILPPVSTPHGVLVDGGVLDNLPVDVMRGIHRGPVIAVDVAREHSLDTDWLERELARPWYSKILSPPIISILMRSGTVGGDTANRLQANHADITIAPALEDIEIRQWKVFEKTIDIGYRAARKALQKTSMDFLTHKPHKIL